MALYLSVCLPACLSVCFFTCMSVCLSACPPVGLSTCLSFCLPFYMPVCVFTCLSDGLSFQSHCSHTSLKASPELIQSTYQRYIKRRRERPYLPASLCYLLPRRTPLHHPGGTPHPSTPQRSTTSTLLATQHHLHSPPSITSTVPNHNELPLQHSTITTNPILTDTHLRHAKSDVRMCGG